MSVAAMRELIDNVDAPCRPEAVTMIGATAMSGRAKPPIGSNSGSAAATRSSRGPAPLSVGSDNDVAASASAKLSPATTITDFGQECAPHHVFDAPRLDAPPLVRSLVVKGKLARPRSASVTARLVSKRSFPRKRSACASASMRGDAPGPVGHRLGCSAFAPSSARAETAVAPSAPRTTAIARSGPESQRARGIGGAP